MDIDDARRLLKSVDPSAARELVTEVADRMDGLAAQVWAFGLAEGPRRALAIVAQMGAELAVGAATLYAANRWYAGAALVRQLIEVEYLLFLFASDDEEPERWLRVTPEEARRMFQPAVMRDRAGGRFRSEEYASHCEMGGHPRLRGHVLLREHHGAEGVVTGTEWFDPAVQWVDLAQHVERMWGNYGAAVQRHSPSNVYPDRFEEVSSMFARWRVGGGPNRI
jgi:hypothetical protein